MSEDCIYFTQNPNEIRKEFKNAKYHDAFSVLKKQRLHYPKNVIFGRRNINSLQNTFDSIAELIQGNVDIFLINENKLGESFPRNQFATGYKLIQKKYEKVRWRNCFSINDQLPDRHSYSDYRSNNTQK